MFFLTQKWEVIYGTVAQKNPNSINLKNIGVKELSLELNSSSFDDLVTQIDPTIVVFDRFITEEQFGWRVVEHCSKALRILDTEDLHCLRKTRHEALKKGNQFSNELLLNSEIAKREIASIYRSDLSLIISSYELKLLKEVFQINEQLLIHLPFLLEEITNKNQQEWKSFEERNHFISIGNFLHAPNMDATIQLKKSIWEKIRKKLPSAELHIYGAYPNQQVLEYTNSLEGFFVHGFVKDAKKVIENSRVLLAPLRFGAGIKGKLTDAMLCGTPSMTTSIGSEGMTEKLFWSGFVEDDMEEFVTKAIQLYTDKKVWSKAQKNGAAIINDCYSKAVHEIKLLDRISEAYLQMQKNRNQNFVGKMLYYHSLQSTKYMSKWIEAKNK